MRKTSRYHMLCSMANTGCLLLSGSGMLTHSLQCPPAFLYLPEVVSRMSGAIQGNKASFENSQRRGRWNNKDGNIKERKRKVWENEIHE
ncbi:hypothetical protein DPX16_22145 [Anabarilius grahami]|uniref:Uncharacterized protein n=1 Tax=Anabarilius grahami TaxID=495550 RepID=A0A3N0XNF6_ANAGA|nr:hypothetical protein DPX16_22145 [Anabarilius grahami]